MKDQYPSAENKNPSHTPVSLLRPPFRCALSAEGLSITTNTKRHRLHGTVIGFRHGTARVRWDGDLSLTEIHPAFIIAIDEPIPEDPYTPAILQCLADGPRTSTKLQDATGLAYHRLMPIIEQLTAAGRIVATGRMRTRTYRLPSVSTSDSASERG